MTTNSQNIAILGAGIMGLSAAYALSKAGHIITLYEPQGFPAPNASWMAGGMLAPYSEIEHMSQDWVDAGLEGIKLWQKNFPDLVQQNGSLLIAHPEDHHSLKRFISHLPTDKANMRSASAMESQLSTKFSHGLFLEEEAHLDPRGVMQALCKTKATWLSEGSKPQSLSANYDLVIDCRGMGAHDKDLRGVKGEIAIVRNPEFNLLRPVRLMHPRYPLYIIPRPDNVFMIGATVIEAEDEQVSVRSGLELLSALYSLHPSFAEAEIIEMQAGIRPSYSNNLPRIKINENIISCNGLFRHGYLLAPVMAECVADYAAGETHKFWTLFTKGELHDHQDQRREKDIRSAA